MKLVLLVACGLLLAGCAVPRSEPGSSSPATTGPATTDAASTTTAGTSSSTTGAPSSSGCAGSMPGHCAMGHALQLFISVRAGGEVGVPLPHGSWCLPPQDWAVTQSFNATATLRTVDRGQVFWVVAERNGSLTVAINLEGRSACQTFRYDPWSVDPDPQGDAMPINATVATQVSIQVQEVSGYCYSSDPYTGTAGPGWTELPKGQRMMVCQ